MFFPSYSYMYDQLQNFEPENNREINNQNDSLCQKIKNRLIESTYFI